MYLLALSILNFISSTSFYIVPLVFWLFWWVFLSSKEPTRFWSLSATFMFHFVFVLGKKKSSVCSGIQHGPHSDTTPLGSRSTFWNYRDKLIWETNQEVQVLTDALSGHPLGAEGAFEDWHMWQTPDRCSPFTSWDFSPAAQFTLWLFRLNMGFPSSDFHPHFGRSLFSPWSSVLCEGWWMASFVLMLVLRHGSCVLLLSHPETFCSFLTWRLGREWIWEHRMMLYHRLEGGWAT